MEGGIKTMLAIEERCQKVLNKNKYEFFQSSYQDIQFSLLHFLKAKTSICNTENVST